MTHRAKSASPAARLRAGALALLLGWAWDAPAAGLEIPVGASVDLAGGRLDLAGGDLVDQGALSVGAGRIVGAGAIRVLAGGAADLGSGVVQLGGDWENAGAVNAGSGRVEFRDGGAPSSRILGSTTFADLSLVTGSGKRYRLQSTLTQAVAGTLEIRGVGPPIQIDVTAPGSVAFLNLLPTGQQTIANVGVSDVHAIGQHLAPGETNRGGNGNDRGWFGNVLSGAGVPIPTLSPWAMSLLALLLLVAATLRSRASRR